MTTQVSRFIGDDTELAKSTRSTRARVEWRGARMITLRTHGRIEVEPAGPGSFTLGRA